MINSAPDMANIRDSRTKKLDRVEQNGFGTKFMNVHACVSAAPRPHDLRIFHSSDIVPPQASAGFQSPSVNQVFSSSGCAKLAFHNHLVKHAREVTDFLIKDIELTEVQVDEMWSFIKKQKNVDEGNDYTDKHGDYWIYIAKKADTKPCVIG
ncbi:MAG: hypothetical protein EF812_04960 [Methanosarcinales archaeon]|nr:MAG: hypothetical protein EF812_04960 [Methanosarcinales archaeon]